MNHLTVWDPNTCQMYWWYTNPAGFGSAGSHQLVKARVRTNKGKLLSAAMMDTDEYSFLKSLDVPLLNPCSLLNLNSCHVWYTVPSALIRCICVLHYTVGGKSIDFKFYQLERWEKPVFFIEGIPQLLETK